MTFDKLRADLDKGKKGNFYIFTGEEKEVLRRYIARIDENAKTVDSAEQLIKHLTNTGLFATEETYVLYNSSDIQKISAEGLKKRAGNNTVILVYDSTDGRKKFFRDGKKYITEFKKFGDGQLISHIKNQLPEITDEMAYIITKCSNNEISRIENEIHKLKFLDDINMETMADVLTPIVDDQIFEMIDSVAGKNKNRAFDIYYDLIEMGESQIKIIALLYMKFKQLFLVQNYYTMSNKEIMDQTGLNYGQVNFTKNLVGSFQTNRIIEIIKSIQETEVAVKTGRVDMVTGTEDLMLKIFQ